MTYKIIMMIKGPSIKYVHQLGGKKGSCQKRTGAYRGMG